jgi:cellulose synthase/poly-beta-1,6-N-acetylglucosamine synthase-like glycosyltransferase
VIVADDSRDETIEILKELNKKREKSTIKYVHRKDRKGFKGGALQEAVSFMNPNTKYVVILDADFIPPPDILKKFLWYFESQYTEVNKNENNGNGNGHRFEEQVLSYYENGKTNCDDGDIYDRVDNWLERRRIGVVQGYQLHHLNKNENWITKGIRAEFSGGYMIERVAEEFFGSMKMITGSVFMIRADILKKLGWTNSITEDWDLTLRMYLEGYKVLYTPLIQASAEIPTTIRALARQRMRWAEGHTFAVKKYFLDILRSTNITPREKMEFIYFAPYYLQSFFFLIGTFFWVIAELLDQQPFFWTATFGWCLILSNLFALPLMSLSGLYLEQTARQDFTGIFSFIVLSYVLTPFQAYAAIKGLLEKNEGGWVRTLKTGSITDRVLQVRVRRLFSWILPRRESKPKPSRKEEQRKRRSPSALVLIFLILTSTLIVWVTAAAMSIPVSESESTFLSLEYISPAVTIYGKTTSHILTHPDYTSLTQLHTDAYTLSGDRWQKAWEFYLYGPFENDYKLKGDLDFYLFLYSDQEREVDIKILITDLDEGGETDLKFSSQFKNVDIGDESPESPLILSTYVNKSIKFREGHSIVVEILFNGEAGASFYFEYGSQDRNSKVDFPGMVMPESIMLILLIAPMIPIAVLKLRRRRELGVE